jgi:hypothetical protein
LCEKAISEKILERFPGHAILGEEAVAPGIDAAIAALEEKLSVPGWLWIVDPVRDGLAVCTLVVDLSSHLRHLHYLLIHRSVFSTRLTELQILLLAFL